MDLVAGLSLGPYEIIQPLGSGGMGQVYRARDTRLARDVALKVLPKDLADDPTAIARFDREAKAVAALSHPNILAVYDFGSHDGVAFLVTELLEGETLRKRLQEPTAPHKALDWAIQIARGLAAAHARGIVHRDLKPDNVFITRDGVVKILDFGLARRATPEEMSSAPTITNYDGTKIFGTIGYMAPEQACGERVDPAADVFAFGALLYEMLTRRRAFLRATFAESLSATLRDEPPMDELKANLPQIVPVLRRCLEKRPEERYQSTDDLAFQLASIGRSPVGAATDTQTSWTIPSSDSMPTLSPARLRTLATLLGGVILGWFGALAFAPEAPQPSTETATAPKVRRLTFSGTDRAPSASPDGRLVAFASTRDGRSRIWLKQLGSGSEAPLTDGVDDLPRFSPDGSSILFIREQGDDSALFRVDLLDPRPRKILDQVSEADWAPDGRGVAFLRGLPSGEEVVGLAQTDGSDVRILTTAPQLRLSGLRYSPDGRRLVASETARSNTSPKIGFRLIDPVDGSTREISLPKGGRLSRPEWSGDDALIYALSESLLGDMQHTLSKVIRRDLSTGEEDILFWAENLFVRANTATFSVAGDDRLLFDRVVMRQNLFGSGKELPRLTSGMSRDRQPIFSPDGENLLFSSDRSGNLDLWRLHLPSGELTQLTDDPASDWDPAFLPGGEYIVWSSSRGGHLEIWTAALDGGGAEQLSNDGENAENPTATRDGEYIVYCSVNREAGGLWRMRRDGSEPELLAEGLYVLPEVSPDGRYVLTLAPIGRQSSDIRVFDLQTETWTDFVVPIFTSRLALGWTVAVGRSRWMPDSKAIAFLGQNDEGRVGVFVQEFSPDRDTTSTRRPLAGFMSDSVIESFAVHPDGERLALSVQTIELNLMSAESL